MGFLPGDLREEDLVWLLDIDWLGRTIRLSDKLRVVPFGENGEDVEYKPGLTFSGSVEQALDLFSDASSLPAVSLTMDLSGVVNVPREIARGRDFAAATGKLYLWIDGSGSEQQNRIVVVSGQFREPEYGDQFEPITSTLEELPVTKPALVPARSYVINETTWPDAPELSQLQWYPQIVGSPGAGSTYGSVAFAVDFVSPSTSQLLIAGHKVSASSVTVTNGDDNSSGSVSVSHVDDGNNKEVAVVNIHNHGNITEDVDSPYYVQWPTTPAGIAGRSGSAMTGAGEALRWLLEQSTLRWDRARMAAVVDYLNAYRVDFSLQAEPESRVDPWEFIQSNLLPILPVTPAHATASGGLSFVLWRFDATEEDAIASLNADRSDVVRQSPVSFSDIDDIVNEFRFSYAFNINSNKPTKSYTLSGDELVIADGAASNNHCRVSVNRYGVRIKEDSSSIVYDSSTAAKVCAWWSRAFALASKEITYQAPSHFAFLELGDTILLTDASLHFSDQLCLVAGITWRSGRNIDLTLRIIEDPARDPRSV